MYFVSPTYGKLSRRALKQHISLFMKLDQSAQYRLIIGVDSQRNATHTFDFVTAVIIQRLVKEEYIFGNDKYYKKRLALKSECILKQLCHYNLQKILSNYSREMESLNMISKYTWISEITVRLKISLAKSSVW